MAASINKHLASSILAANAATTAARGRRVRVVFGAMTFGGQTNDATGLKMLKGYLKVPSKEKKDEEECVDDEKNDRAHLNYMPEIDTAHAYTGSEKVLGRLFKQLNKNTHSTFSFGSDAETTPSESSPSPSPSSSSSPSPTRVLLSTKVNPSVRPHCSLSAASVRSQLELSLKRLGLNRVDVVYLHVPDLDTPITDTLRAMHELHKEGLFVELGLSNYAAWQVVEIYQICKANGWVTPTVYQGMYNAITREVEKELIPALRRCGMRFDAYNPLAGGLLTGKHKSFDDGPESGRFHGNNMYMSRYWTPAYFGALDLVRDACGEANVPMAAASLRWLVHHSHLQCLDQSFTPNEGVKASIRAAGSFECDNADDTNADEGSPSIPSSPSGNTMSDAVVIGASSLSHFDHNLAAIVDGGPLPDGVVKAFDEAWKVTSAACPKYFRP